MARTQRPTPAQPRVDLADEAPFEPLGSEVEPRSLAREACSTLAAHQPTCAHRLPLSISALQHRHCVGAMVRDVDRRYLALDGSTQLVEPIREDVLDFVLADEDGRSIGTDVAVHRDVAEELAVTMQREGVEWHASLHEAIAHTDGGEDLLRSGPQIGGLRVSFRQSFLVDDAERHAPAMKLVGEREADRSRADDQNLAVSLHFRHGSLPISVRKCVYIQGEAGVRLIPRPAHSERRRILMKLLNLGQLRDAPDTSENSSDEISLAERRMDAPKP